MKKLTSLVMILALSVFSIGCGGGDEPTAPAPPAGGGDMGGGMDAGEDAGTDDFATE